MSLKDLEGLVQVGRRDLNVGVAINRLPAEVLREIFVTTCTVKLARYRHHIMTVWSPTWIDKGRATSLMLVCCRWKEIALGIRELWNGIETYRKHEDHTLLERSGRGPLKVLACGKLEPSCAVAHALQNVEHSSRIQELYWERPLSCEDLRMPAPSLKSLALQDDRSDSVPDGSLKLFDNHTPCLERLSLSYVQWLPSNAFAKLTFLALDHCNIPKAPIKLRNLLVGTPNLVDLILRSVPDSSYPHVQVDFEAAGMKPVMLTRLRRLLIGDMWADDIDYVFRDARLNETLVSSWSLNALKQPKQLHFQPQVAIVTGASSGLRYEVRRNMTLEDWTTFNWPQILPLSSVSHLCTFACKGPGLERVRSLLRQMTTLQTLSVDIDGLTKIINTLTLFRDPIDPPLCPTLMTLRIVIPKYSDSDYDIILDSILPQLGIKHLYLGLIDPSDGRWRGWRAVKDQLHGNFESVKFETLCCNKAYDTNLPLICVEMAHALWSPWYLHWHY
ncbi:uncharacterized protein LAESUDRAFT_813013 [Laetiporus sulphureus 93-53]|uniref:F-box domain-containing protein n=1 Tax=Laetiporus sulphureus 93-53 TaxID=1314785 RepID=A0A165E1X8_9APHY|nr:uncharacterized protein LAESUDRAFT_813013 [Laetiporus sulphureus 93-53]KZT06087.1 hypothetical protein LAESUDRAFT_813013 [Laetiporus sulphureus 93-53]